MSKVRVSLFFVLLLAAPLSFAAHEFGSAAAQPDHHEESELSPNTQMALGIGVGCAAIALRTAMASYIGDLYCGRGLTSGLFHRSTDSDSLALFLAYHTAGAVAVEGLREFAVPLLCKIVGGKPKPPHVVDVVNNASRVTSGAGLLGYSQVIMACVHSIVFGDFFGSSQPVQTSLDILLSQPVFSRSLIRRALEEEGRKFSCWGEFF